MSKQKKNGNREVKKPKAVKKLAAAESSTLRDQIHPPGTTPKRSGK